LYHKQKNPFWSALTLKSRPGIGIIKENYAFTGWTQFFNANARMVITQYSAMTFCKRIPIFPKYFYICNRNQNINAKMSQQEQQDIKLLYYTEAIRYMDNAKVTLKKAGKDEKFYTDRKYVRTACGTAYNGLLIALDGYLLLKGIKKTKGRKSIEYYQKQFGQMDRKLLSYINDAYELLHLNGYYDGTLNITVIKAGFDDAYEIINRIKPEILN
jgi:uncharacterized protein (UPF0332 family)